MAVLVYAASLMALAVLLVLRGGRSEAGTIITLCASLVALLLGGLVRAQSTHGETVWTILVGAWLCWALTIGTKGNPFRAILNSADLARSRGYGPWRGEDQEVGRYVRPPVRWPTLTLFFGGAALLLLVVPA
ncbi:hypothetical protein [Oerskovia turbata]